MVHAAPLTMNISRMLCQKWVSRAGTSNYIPRILWDVITWRSWKLLLAQHPWYEKMHIFNIKRIMFRLVSWFEPQTRSMRSYDIVQCLDRVILQMMSRVPFPWIWTWNKCCRPNGSNLFPDMLLECPALFSYNATQEQVSYCGDMY